MYKACLLSIILCINSVVSYDTMSETRKALGLSTHTSCEPCAVFTESFSNGMKRTSGSSYGGGNPSWEERNLNPYSTSEIRFVEIQEQLCQDVPEPDLSNSCHRFGENHEQDVENWWFNLQPSNPDLYQYLCVDKLKICKCRKGWTEGVDGKCVDIDECEAMSPCRDYQYCHNTDGGFSCLDCDRACDGCTGPGASNCKACAMKYNELDGVCVHEQEEAQHDLVYWTRIFILIYLLVFLGTCLFMKNYALVVTILGIGLGIYISLPDKVFQPVDEHIELYDFGIPNE